MVSHDAWLMVLNLEMNNRIVFALNEQKDAEVEHLVVVTFEITSSATTSCLLLSNALKLKDSTGLLTNFERDLFQTLNHGILYRSETSNGSRNYSK